MSDTADEDAASVTADEVRHVADLARVDLADEEVDEFAADGVVVVSRVDESPAED